jgi:predicted DNA-binding transcriptional regulator AlpA
MHDQFLTTQQAATCLGLQPRTLERWRWKGTGPRFRKLGGAVRYAPGDIATWADGATRRSTSDPGSLEVPNDAGL